MADAPLALELYATLRAEIDAGEEMLGVIDRENVTESTWASAQAFWLKKMAEEAETKRFESTNRYQAIYVAKKKVFESKRARKRAKEAQPPIQEPAVGALDDAAKHLVAAALTEIPALVVPKAPVVEQIVAAPSFELPPPLVPPPAPVIAPPPRVGPSHGSASGGVHTAPMTNTPTSAGLPFAPASAAHPPFVGRTAFPAAPPRSDTEEGREPDTVRPPGDGRTMAVDIDALLREVKAGGTPFAAASAAPPPSAPPSTQRPSGPASTPPANPNFLSTVAVDLASVTSSKNSATPFSQAPGAVTPPSSRTSATPFASPVQGSPVQGSRAQGSPVQGPPPQRPPENVRASPPALEALEGDDDDDDAPRTKMITEEAAKLLSRDIPMSSAFPRGGPAFASEPRSPSAAPLPPPVAPPAGAARPSASRPGEPPREPSPEGTLAPETAVPALRDPGGGLPFQRGPMRQTGSGVMPAAPALAGAITPPQVPAAQPAAAGRIFSLNQFASLTAEIAVYPERTADIRQRYGVTESVHLAESKRWTEEFATNTELRQRYFGLVQTYREYLQKQKG